ncbi:MAG TPA: hypothetical protein VF612_14515 [Jatrophihabitans sp.]|jgi:TolB protein|uniref:hypothetical protein n=1 Tax=Jatrophihabitans sp. TaxID=1932789 RepID=UPI002EFE92D8
MNSHTEERLRAAFEAKADQVTAERLDQLAAQRLLTGELDPTGWNQPEGRTDLPPARAGAVRDDELTPLKFSHRTAGTRHARWLAPALAAAAVAAITVAVTAITMSDNGSAPTPNPPASQISTPAPSLTPTPSNTPPQPQPSSASPVTATPPAQAPLLGNGKQAGRSEVPWNQVGHGWFLALTNGAAPALYLINPIGGRYLITDHLPDAENRIAQWSPDGKRVMLSREQGTAHIITELELATGRILHTVNLGERGFLDYTRPQGRAILVTRLAGTSPSLERLATDGSHQLAYPRTLPGSGQIGFPVLYNADGTGLLVGGSQGMTLLGNDGHLIRTLPATADVRGCWPVKWWSSSTVLETCVSKTGSSYALFLQPVAGGQPEKLAAASKTHPGGFSNAWRYSEGTLLSEGGGCGPGRLNVLRNGAIRILKLPAGVAEDPPVIGVDGDLLTLRRLGGCPVRDEESVISFNLVTGATTTLFTGDAQLIPYPWQ